MTTYGYKAFSFNVVLFETELDMNTNLLRELLRMSITRLFVILLHMFRITQLD